MKKRVLLLRIAYVWGMIADLFEGIRMSVPRLFIASSGTLLKNGPELANGLLYGVPVMLGWTLVLFWANRRPMERKGVLLCLIPVIFGYMIVQGVGIASGAYPASKLLMSYILQTVLLVLALIGYVSSSGSQNGIRKNGTI